MSSGVKLDAGVHNAYEKFKMKKNHRLLTLRISDEPKAWIIEKEVMKADDTNPDPLTECYSLLSDGKARFCFLDHPVSNKASKAIMDQLFLIQFIPDTCPIKDKMVYASSSQPVKTMCEDTCKFVQLNDLEDLNTALLQTIYETK